jgi:hypothetical protein
MKAFSIVGLLFATVVVATIRVSPQVTPRGVELTADQAQAVTCRRARRNCASCPPSRTAMCAAPCGVVLW